MCEDSNTETTPDCQEEKEEPLYLQLWKIQRKKKDGTWSNELAEKKYEELKDLHQQQLEKYGVDNLTPHEAFTCVLKQRKGSHHQRGMGQGVMPYACYKLKTKLSMRLTFKERLRQKPIGVFLKFMSLTKLVFAL